ncbi:3-hydroxy-3-methylglutaryl-coenzyme A reductase [Cichlidogyrus casuarinus]|uniref:hydroxymethylglutaryl-CoA reductase (NADPH) n=1 Tax=Cichlidogyrus casuarinus TaxID=1844966 RepID=A0ABD2PWF8_9PLAT
MGMNMVTKATESALRMLRKEFPRVRVISLSGNMCSDKKPSSINYILGRGKSVLAEVRIPEDILQASLKTTPQRLARLALSKNFAGSAMACSPGMAGCNAHAANIVAAVFAATGQDLAQVVDSSACLTMFEQEETEKGSVLIASVTMPCLEVGVIGGGTRLPAQQACINLMDLDLESPSEHFARLLAALVLAGELSLMAALDTSDLVSAHMKLNRAAGQGSKLQVKEVSKLPLNRFSTLHQRVLMKQTTINDSPPQAGEDVQEERAATRARRRLASHSDQVSSLDVKHSFM